MPRAVRSRAEGDPRVFRALADATRRKILRVLGGGEMRAGDVAKRFPQSRPAIAKHLKVLLDAGLVTVRKDGRERRYALARGPLREAAARVQELDAFWEDALARLGDEIGKGPRGL